MTIQKYQECTMEDEKLLATFTVDTDPYSRHHFGCRKQTAAVKLKVELLLVEEQLQLIVRITIHNCFCFRN